VTPAARTILFATVIAYFLQKTVPGIENLFVFYPGDVLTHPWTIVTYMFLHGGFTHILFNMIGLYFFGPRVEARIGSRRFTTLYFLSGVSGALLSLVLAPRSPIIGASAGVFGVMLAFAHYWPHDLIYIYGVIPVPARVLVILTTLLTLWSGFSGGGSGIAHFAHLGGYVGAFLYVRWIDRAKGNFRRQIAATAPKPAQVGNYKNIDRSAIHEVNRAEVDRILDKINAQGIDSLTPQERLFLSNFVPMDDRKPPVS
jgi:membrane associated rhomboid family serine protease